MRRPRANSGLRACSAAWCNDAGCAAAWRLRRTRCARGVTGCCTFPVAVALHNAAPARSDLAARAAPSTRHALATRPRALALAARPCLRRRLTAFVQTLSRLLPRTPPWATRREARPRNGSWRHSLLQRRTSPALRSTPVAPAPRWATRRGARRQSSSWWHSLLQSRNRTSPALRSTLVAPALRWATRPEPRLRSSSWQRSLLQSRNQTSPALRSMPVAPALRWAIRRGARQWSGTWRHGLAAMRHEGGSADRRTK